MSENERAAAADSLVTNATRAADHDDREWTGFRWMPLVWLVILFGAIAIGYVACAIAAMMAGGDAASDAWGLLAKIGARIAGLLPSLGVALAVSATVVLSVSALTGFGSAQSQLAQGLLVQLEWLLFALMAGLTLAAAIAVTIPISDPYRWPEYVMYLFLLLILVQASLLSTRARRELPEARYRRLSLELKRRAARAADVFGANWDVSKSATRMASTWGLIRNAGTVLLGTLGLHVATMSIGVAISFGWVYVANGSFVWIVVLAYIPTWFWFSLRLPLSDRSLPRRTLRYYPAVFGSFGALLAVAVGWVLIAAGPPLQAILIAYVVSGAMSLIVLFAPVFRRKGPLRSLDVAVTFRSLRSFHASVESARAQVPASPVQQRRRWFNRMARTD